VQVGKDRAEALELDFIDTQPHRCFTLIRLGQYRHVLVKDVADSFLVNLDQCSTGTQLRHALLS
jgi:hypothetical protein